MSILSDCHPSKKCESAQLSWTGVGKTITICKIRTHVSIFRFPNRGLFKSVWVVHSEDLLSLIQVLRDPFSGIECSTDRGTVLLFERDVFLDQRIDISQNVVDVHADLISLLFGNTILIGVVLGFDLLNLRFELLVCFFLFF